MRQKEILYIMKDVGLIERRTGKRETEEEAEEEGRMKKRGVEE